MIWIMLMLFFTLLFLGVPVAFSMITISVLGLIFFDLPLMMLIQKLHSGLDHFPFLAVPFFILAGMLMETGGISQRMVNLAKSMVGHIRGSLGMAVVVSEILFSGISGSSIADASAIGSTLIPPMKQAGYSDEHSVCIVNAASGMGILIPPCLIMVILAAIADLSIAILFFAGFLPGFFMGICLMLLVYYQARTGILPGAEEPFSLRRLGSTSLHSIIPMMVPVIIFGGILGGIATATEVAVLAVVYALFVGLVIYREIKISELHKIFIDTLMICGAVGILTGAAMAFSFIIATQDVPVVVANLILKLTSNPYIFLVIANIVFIVATALMDGLPALLIFYPILSPIALQMGIHPIHFTILAVAATGIGLSAPPIGLIFIVVCAISKTSPSRVFKPYIPYFGILVVSFLAILFMPWLVLIVPKILFPEFG